MKSICERAVRIVNAIATKSSREDEFPETLKGDLRALKTCVWAPCVAPCVLFFVLSTIVFPPSRSFEIAGLELQRINSQSTMKRFFKYQSNKEVLDDLDRDLTRAVEVFGVRLLACLCFDVAYR